MPTHFWLHVFTLVSVHIKPFQAYTSKVGSVFFFFFLVGCIPSLFQILSPDLTYFILTLPGLKPVDSNWAGSQPLQLALVHIV